MKTFRYFLLLILIYVFTGCAAEVAMIGDRFKNMIPSSKKIINNRAKDTGAYLLVDKKFNMNTVRNIVVSNDKRYLVTVSLEKNVIITDLRTGKLVKKIIGDIGIGSLGKVSSIAISSDDRYLAIGGNFFGKNKKTSSIRIYDFKNFKLVKTLVNHKAPISALDFSPDRKYLISSDLGKKLIVWNLDDFSVAKKIILNTKTYIVKIVKDRGKYKIFTLGKDNKIKLYDFFTGNLIDSKFVGLKVNTFDIGKKEIAVGALMYGYIDIYDFNLNRIDKIKLNNNPRSITYSKDGRFLSVAMIHKKEGVNIYDRQRKNRIYRKIKNEEIYTSKFIDNINILLIDGNKNLKKFNIKNRKYSVIRNGNNIIKMIGFKDDKVSFRRNVGNIKAYNSRKSYSFNKYFDFEKLQVIKKRVNFNLLDKEKNNYKLEMKGVKSLAGTIPYVILSKNGKEIAKKQWSNRYFNNFAFFENYIVALGKANFIYNLEFDRIGGLASNASLIAGVSKYKNFLLTLSNENTIEFWDLKSLNNNELHVLYPKLTLYIGEDNEWIMWTPEGYFNSSENGYKYVGFHINQGYDKEAKWVGIEKLYDHFYRPDLVELALDGKDITPYTNGLTYKDVLKNPAPEVRITKVNHKKINKNRVTHYKDKISLNFDVKSVDSGGVGLIRVYQEGKLVKTIGDGKINRTVANVDEQLETEELTKKAKKEQDKYLASLENIATKSINGTINEEELIQNVNINTSIDNSGSHKIILPLKAGNNKIEIEAFNKTNTVVSIRKKIIVNAKIKRRKPIVYAIVAGVNKFEKTGILKNLKYSENDAKTIRNILKLKIREKVVPTLLLGKDFTKENLEEAIEKIKSKARLEDKIVFYVSTHGKTYKGDLFLVPQNNKRAKNWIRFEDIFKKIQSISALEQIFVVDACESGKAKDIVSSIYDSKASVLAKQSGVHVLLATAKGTFAFEHPNPKIKHGVFTNNILKALNSKKTDKNRDKKISIVELSKVLKSPEYITEYQYPIIRNIGQDIKIRDF